MTEYEKLIKQAQENTANKERLPHVNALLEEVIKNINR